MSTDNDTGWKADPKRGQEQVEPRRQEIVELLKGAADVAFFHIEQETQKEIEAIHKKAAEKKTKIMKSIRDAEKKPAMEIVRKYWNEKPGEMWRHFVHNMTERSGAA